MPHLFTCFSQSRPAKQNFGRAWGGVLAIVSHALSLIHWDDLGGPDFQVLQFPSSILYNVYILPEQSPWQHWTKTHPTFLLAESLIKAKQVGLPIFILGDINGHTASAVPFMGSDICQSQNGLLNTRGHWLLRLCMDYSLHILNGLNKIEGQHDSFTSFQPGGSSVIDYALCCHDGIEMIKDLNVLPNEQETSDHAALVLRLMIPSGSCLSQLQVKATRRKFVPRPLPADTELDCFLIEVVDSKASGAELTALLYGLVFFDTNPVTVYTDGSCVHNGTQHAAAGYGVYWGKNNALNKAG